MVTNNVQNKLPGKALWYLLFARAIIGIILIVVGVAVMSMGTIQGSQTINGVTSPTSFPSAIPAVIIILIGIIIPLWSLFWYMTFSYIVGDQNITINSGVVFRQSRTIDFNKIQNINN